MKAYVFEPGILEREGGHIYEGVSGTLRAKPGDNQMTVAYGVDCYNQTVTLEKAKCMTNKATDSDHVPCVAYSIENHPNDSRVKIAEDNKVQTLTERMGTGGGNVPIVMETFHCNTEDNKTPPIKARDYKDPLVVVMDRATYNQGENARYDFECRVGGAMPPIIARGPGAVCYWNGENKVGTLTANNANGAQRMPDKEHFNCVIESYVFDQGASRDVGKLFLEEQSKTITNGTCPGHHNGVIEMGTEYIVRRLTPLECGRLQGFPDGWAEIDPKEDFTDEEYHFWLDVRNTWAEINGKQTKEYTKEQMVKWYNKLHTDSAEYKMWGNGIGLPNALYVMEGIAEALEKDNEERTEE